MPPAAENTRKNTASTAKTPGASALSGAVSCKLTPKSRLHLGQTASSVFAKPHREQGGLQLTLKNVIGTTTSSANAFDAIPEEDTFVCCAGPAVILSRVNEHQEISQRLYRARESTSAINLTPSFYNPSTPPSTPSRSHQGSPLKERSYGVGPSAFYENGTDSPAHGRANSRGREVTCVSLSPSNQLLAVGETGYNPRVLLFSTALDAPSDIPLSVLTDHSFGVACVGFSHDSKWLCTVGNCYDGFILIYSINVKTGSARLHSSNKCSNVNRIFWMGHSIVSIGLRHIKVWRLDLATQTSPSKTRPDLETNVTAPADSPMPKTFSGRNCLLGALMDAAFTAAAALSDTHAVLCTSQGDVCLLDDTERMQRLRVASKLDFCIKCVTIDRQRGIVWLAGGGGIMRSIPLMDLFKPMASPPTLAAPTPHDMKLVQNSEKVSDTLAIGIMRDRIITIDSDRVIQIRAAEEDGKGSHLPRVIKRLPAHDSAVLGLRSLLPKVDSECPDFLTFSRKGTVILWKLDGTCTGTIEVTLDQTSDPEEGFVNELKVVIPSIPNDCLVCGDKAGVLRLINRSGNHQSVVQAHSGDINGITIAKVENLTLVVTCGRDRTVQLFNQHDSLFKLLHTLDDHAASVTDVLFGNYASHLLSISSDRTIIVRKLAYDGVCSLAYLTVRVITLKASPISFSSVPEEPNMIMVSMMDRQVQRYDVSSGRLLHSFKASDSAGSETVMFGSLEVSKLRERGKQTRLLSGVSSTDKSIRIHDYVSGSMLTKEHGQTTVSAIKVIQNLDPDGLPLNTLISCGLDGTIMIYDLSLPRDAAIMSQDSSDVSASPSSRLTQPLRRILSRTEISGLQRSLEADGDMIKPLRGTSPTRLRRKSSRFSLAGTRKSYTPTAEDARSSPANARFTRKSSQSSTGSSPQGPGQSKAKRPSVIDRRRSKSAANLNDLSDAADQICKSLRMFRKRITSASMDKLEPKTVRELESELILTSGALTERTNKGKAGNEKAAGDFLDDYLARMIDERLALKAKSWENSRSANGANVVAEEDEDQNHTVAGAEMVTETK